MKAKAIKSFRIKGEKRIYRKGDVLELTKSQFDSFNGIYVTKANINAIVTPERVNENECTTCNLKK